MTRPEDSQGTSSDQLNMESYVTSLRSQLEQSQNALTQQNVLIQQLQSAMFQAQTSQEHLKNQISVLTSQTESKVTIDQLPRSFKAPNLENFSGTKGEDLESWLFQTEEQFQLLGVTTDSVKILMSGMAFRKNAKTWYKSVRGPDVPEDERIHDWDTFVAILREHFSPVDPTKLARDELASLKQTGSVRDYTAHFRQLCSTIRKIADEEKLDRYVRGLKFRIQREVNLRNPTTYLEATQLAERIDITFDRAYNMSDERPRERHNKPTPMDLNSMERGGRDHRQKGKQDHHGMKRDFKPLTEAEKQGRKDRNECLYCGSKDHQLHSCPLKPRKGQGNGHRHPNRGA